MRSQRRVNTTHFTIDVDSQPVDVHGGQGSGQASASYLEPAFRFPGRLVLTPHSGASSPAPYAVSPLAAICYGRSFNLYNCEADPVSPTSPIETKLKAHHARHDNQTHDPRSPLRQSQDTPPQPPTSDRKHAAHSQQTQLLTHGFRTVRRS